MKNIQIRNEIERRGLMHWQVADALGIHEATFCKHLRHELPPEEQAHVLQVIKAMGGGKHE